MSRGHGASGKASRDLRLEELGLGYPFWVFTVDEPPWPRTVASIPAGSRPAQITGWYRWGWEYGTDLRRIDDKLPPHVIFDPPKIQHPNSVQQILDRLRYDDTYESDEFRIVYEAGRPGEHQSRGFAEWSFDSGASGYIAARRIIRVEREWDDVPVWDPENSIDMFSHSSPPAEKAFGLASEVHNDEELLHASGVSPGNEGKSIRKACFAFVDDLRGHCRGAVFPGKLQDNHGLILSRGAEFDYNKKMLVGTPLENRSWADVEAYVSGLMEEPLM